MCVFFKQYIFHCSPHGTTPPPIWHFDIKMSNVLLVAIWFISQTSLIFTKTDAATDLVSLNSVTLILILIPLFSLLTSIRSWSLDLLMLPSLLQLSSKGYNNWIGHSRYPFDVLIFTACITWSFRQYISWVILNFHVPRFLSFTLFSTRSFTLILNSFALCVIFISFL